MQHFQAERFSEEVCRAAAAPGRLSINHMYEEWWLHFAGWATKQGIDSLCPTATQVAAFLLSLCRDNCLAPQVVKASVSAEPHQQGGDGAGQNYP